MTYRTVFDVLGAPLFDWKVVTVCLLLVFSGIAVALLRNKFAPWFLWPPATRRFAAPVALIYFVATIAIASKMLFGSFQTQRELRSELNLGRVGVVEGTVVQFSPAPYSGHVDEKFCVRERCFRYSDYALTGGFNRTSSHGGPIREGLPVRISYVGDVIVRVEIGGGAAY
jgi:hypothetical protein